MFFAASVVHGELELDVAPAATNGVFPRETWESLFQSEGMKNPAPRIQMLDGFNEGWIEFESGEAVMHLIAGSRFFRVARAAV